MHCGAGPTRPGVLHRRDAPLYVAALIASVAIDVDHIPLYLGLLGKEAGRPVPHSLSTVCRQRVNAGPVRAAENGPTP